MRPEAGSDGGLLRVLASDAALAESTHPHFMSPAITSAGLLFGASHFAEGFSCTAFDCSFRLLFFFHCSPRRASLKIGGSSAGREPVELWRVRCRRSGAPTRTLPGRFMWTEWRGRAPLSSATS